MTGKQKNLLGVAGAMVMLVLLILMTINTAIEFHVSRHGESVDATIIDASRVCRSKDKSVTVMIGKIKEELRIYGPSCRSDEFKPGQLIKVRYSKQFNKYTLPDNVNVVRLIFFVVFSTLIAIAMIQLIRTHKKKFNDS